MNDRRLPLMTRLGDALLSLFCGALMLLSVRELGRRMSGMLDDVSVVAALDMLPPLDAIAVARLGVSVPLALALAPLCVLPLFRLGSSRPLELVFPGAAFAAAMQFLLVRNVGTHLFPVWFDAAVALTLFGAMIFGAWIWRRP